MHTHHIFIISLTALLLSACTAVGDSKKAITLDQATRYYETAIRWVDFKAADSLRRLDNNTRDTPAHDTLKRIKVTSYETVKVTALDNNSTMNIQVEIVYYNEDTMKLVTLTDNQIWKYDPDNKSWYITTPLPAFR
jgi:hypothetical protein